MKREYTVILKDSKSKRIILKFHGIVDHKEQKSGRIIGDVIETLYLDSYDIDIKSIDRTITSKDKSISKDKK